MAIRPATILPFLKGARGYSLYVLAVLMLVYLLNQADRFLLGVTGKAIVHDMHFGDFVCEANTSGSAVLNGSCIGACVNIKSRENCTEDRGIPCMLDYSPVGIRFELLAGPAFTFVFTLAAIPLGLLASNKWVNRTIALSFFLILWSGMTLAAAFTHEYWELLLSRIGLGLFEAVCTPFATSIISDRFSELHRGTALGFYNWGIYIGYSLAFSFNFILEALSWRWVFIIASIPGFVMAGIQLLTVREPVRRQQEPSSYVAHKSGGSVIKKVIRAYLQPALLLLCLGGGVRLGAGLVWAYNVKPFFNQLYCGRVNVGVYLSWVPLVGGTMGTLFGGLVSDRLARASGYKGRMWVLILSQVLAAPFLVGTIYAPPNPWAFLCLIPAYIIGETWLGICLTIAIEMVPIEITPASIALFLFITNNISSGVPLLLPIVQERYGLKRALLILFPGLYIVSAALFSLALILLMTSEICRRRSDPKNKAEGVAGSTVRRRQRRRERRSGQETSPLLQEVPSEVNRLSDSDSGSDDFIEVDDDDDLAAGAVGRALHVVPSGATPILIKPSRRGMEGGARGVGGVKRAVSRLERRNYGTDQAEPNRNAVAHPAPVIGSISAWSTSSLTLEDRHWLVESQGGM